MPGARLIPDPGVIEAVRIKDGGRAGVIREACRDTGRIFPLIQRIIRHGMTEIDLRHEAFEQLVRSGVVPFGDLIQGGVSASVPHQPTGTRRFVEGDAVIVDFSAYRGGYLGDMTRTFAIGEIDEEIRRAYAAVRDAQKAAIAAIRPGATCESIDRVARSIIERAVWATISCTASATASASISTNRPIWSAAIASRWRRGCVSRSNRESTFPDTSEYALKTLSPSRTRAAKS
jgi:Xaa-Pro aminopeptidase